MQRVSPHPAGLPCMPGGPCQGDRQVFRPPPVPGPDQSPAPHPKLSWTLSLNPRPRPSKSPILPMTKPCEAGEAQGPQGKPCPQLQPVAGVAHLQGPGESR